jgi:hypothetical protein
VAATRTKVYEKLKLLVTDKCPFVNLPETGRVRWGEILDAEKMGATQAGSRCRIFRVDGSGTFSGIRNSLDCEATKMLGAWSRNPASHDVSEETEKPLTKCPKNTVPESDYCLQHSTQC